MASKVKSSPRDQSFIKKCHKARSILMNDYETKLELEFLKLVDINKLVHIKACDLKPIIENYSDHESDWIKEERRKAINRSTADYSRKRKRSEERELIRDLQNLNNVRSSLFLEKTRLLEEITHYRYHISQPLRYDLNINNNNHLLY